METNSTNRKKGRILIVDDTPKNIQYLGTILRKENYPVNVAQNGLQAIEIVEEVMPDLILLDVMMPDLNGFDTCQRLKESEKTRDIPVIFLTAKTESEDIEKGFSLGAVDYVTKPFNSAELLARVKTHLDLKFKQETVDYQNDQLQQLIHVLCHDLAHPFGNLSSLIDIYESEPELLDSLLGPIKMSVENGLDTITLVREMATLDEHEAELVVQNENLLRLVNTSLSILSHRIKEKSIKVHLAIDKDLTVKVEKRSFINSVVNNLLSNAIKFSFPEHPIDITATIENSIISLSIKDHGIGIPASLLENLFDISKSTTRYGTKGEKGTGFGLPLVKKYVTIYGGEIEVHSVEKTEETMAHGTETILKLIGG